MNEDSAEGVQRMTPEDFVAMFPTAEACLAYLKERFYPDGTECPGCGRASKFHPLRGRSAYSCQFCGTQVYPTAGTIFHRSSTSLQVWFWAIFLIGSTRGRISARALEQELGVTYKTAHRMLTRIRALLGLEPQPAPAPTAPGSGATRSQAPPSAEPAPVARAWHRVRRRG